MFTVQNNDSMEILKRALSFKQYNLRDEYKKQLLAFRAFQVYRRSPDYDDGFDWNTPCGIEDAAAEREHDAILHLRALRLAYQLRRGIGNEFKRHTDNILS